MNMLLETLFCVSALVAEQNAPADEKAAEQAIATFKIEYKAQAEAERADAVTVLARTIHPKTLSKLSILLASNDGPSVRVAAAAGLGGFGALKKQAVPALSVSFPACEKDPQVQAAILESLGKLGDPSALATIHRAFDAKEMSVAKAALAAAAELRNAGSIDPLISFLARTEKSIKAKSGGGTSVSLPSGNLSVHAPRPEELIRALQEIVECTNRSLQTITEQQLTTSADWQAWWNRSRDTFKPK